MYIIIIISTISRSFFPSQDKLNNLQVTPDMREMLESVFSFQPHSLVIPTPLRPFRPKMIPAIGDTDAFTKVLRPDGRAEFLGLTLLDEPGPKQSNPAILEAKLNSQAPIGKQKRAKKDQNVRTIDPNEKGAMV